MRHTTRTGAAALAVMALAFGGLLAGCGSSSKKATSTKATAAANASSTTAEQAAPTPANALVTAKKNDKLGTILADKAGMTLYTLTNNGKAVACTGPCLGAWPPLVLPSGQSTPTGAAGISGLSTASGAAGLRLVAANGLPLYHFIQDKDGEDAYGEGLKSFGGVWHVVKTSATPRASAEATTTPTTPTTSSSGY